MSKVYQPVEDGIYYDDTRLHYVAVHGSKFRTAHDYDPGLEVTLADNARLCLLVETADAVTVPNDVQEALSVLLELIDADNALYYYSEMETVRAWLDTISAQEAQDGE